MSDLPTPINRHEQYLNAIANGTTDNLPTPPITREEVFLDYIARNGGGGGGGDVTGVKGNAESTYRKGNVNLTPENIGLGNVNNTSDASKPVSTATQAALDLKANVADVNIFHGTADDWDSLPLSEKVKYTDAMIEGGSSDNPVGNLNALTTTDKSSCVGAINEVNAVATTSITALSLSGLTLSWLDNMPDSHKAIRVGNLVIVNVGLDIDGTFTGTTGWNYLYDLPASLLNSGESFITPHFTSMMCTNRRDNTIYGALIQGRQIYLDTSIDEYHLRILGQMILPIVKS